MTEWLLCHGIPSADVMVNIRNIVNNWQVEPVYQTAPVLTEYPDSPTVFTSVSPHSSAGFHMDRETLGLTTKYWIRFGYAASNSSGVSIGTADVAATAAYGVFGKEVGRGKIVINPGMISGTDTNYFEIGGWTPTVDFSKMMAALVVMNNLSTYMEVQLVCRTAMDPRAPNAWQECEGGTWDTPASGTSVRNTTALSAPVGAAFSTNLLVQFGLAVRKKSGAGGNPMADIYVAVSASYA
ncbi:MAG: hypothetical protein H6738_00375 [Alphaproteobacteria bacterium]|nr:hypothetical protein [Alphaproteobacteria bacterium]MCB9695222.1 hypothetical protein [Alphaproteobacteria bacterium]